MFEFPDDVQEIDEVIEINNRIRDITSENLVETADFLYNCCYLQNENNMFRFFVNIGNAILERLTKLYLIADLIFLINNKFEAVNNPIFRDQCLERLVEISYHRNCTWSKPGIPFLLALLLEHKLFTPEEVVKRIENIPFEFTNIEAFIHYFTIFLPEFDSYGNKETVISYTNQFKRLNNFQVFARVNQYVKFYETKIEKYREDNWAKLRKKRTSIDSCSEFYRVMREDDIKAFRIIAAFPDFDINGTKKLSLFSPYDYLYGEPPFISIAAFFGSAEIFKFLLVKGADVNKTDLYTHYPSQFAVIGGNIEIIRLLEQENAIFDGTIQVAAGFSRYEIFDWLHSIKFPDLDCFDQHRKTIINQAAMQNNVHFLMTCIEGSAKLYFDDNGICTAVAKASSFGSYDFLKFILMHPDADADRLHVNYHPIDCAAAEGYVEIVELLRHKTQEGYIERNIGKLAFFSIKHTKMIRYLMTLPEIDYRNVRNNMGANLISLTAEYNNFAFLHEILQWDGLDANEPSKSFVSPLHAALIRCNIKCIYILLNHPDIRFNIKSCDSFDFLISHYSLIRVILSDTRILTEFREAANALIPFLQSKNDHIASALIDIMRGKK